MIVEVHNTFGERHCYVLRPRPEGSAHDPAAASPFTAAMDKDFYVSPFISMDGRYGVHVRDDADGLRVAIAMREAGRPMLATSLVLRRRPLSDRSLLRMLLRHPLMPQRTTGLIHWHALRLWRKGAPFYRHGGAAAHRTSDRHPIPAADGSR